ELGDVFRRQFVERGHPEQLHGTDDLTVQQFHGAVDTLAAARHQSVEVCPADQGELCPHSDGGHDVGAVHDAGVEHDLGVVTDGRHHLREQVERHWGTVELTAAVVRHQDPVGPQVGDHSGVVDRLNAFDDELALPLLPQ